MIYKMLFLAAFGLLLGVIQVIELNIWTAVNIVDPISVKMHLSTWTVITE